MGGVCGRSNFDSGPLGDWADSSVPQHFTPGRWLALSDSHTRPLERSRSITSRHKVGD